MPETISTEKHLGYCGHCRTEVHLEANTCSSCQAYWGLKNGESRQLLLKQAQKMMRFVHWYLYFMIISTLLFLVGAHYFIGVLYFGSLLFPLVAVFFLIAKKNKRTALDRSEGVVDWWIKR